jgi:hypothetical protein
LNDADGPFKPLLTTKPHAILPLEQSLGIIVDENGIEQYEPNFRARPSRSGEI